MVNPFTRDRIKRVQSLIKMIRENQILEKKSQIGLKKLMALYILKEGTTKKKTIEYLNDIQDAGIIEFNIEADTVKIL